MRWWFPIAGVAAVLLLGNKRARKAVVDMTVDAQAIVAAIRQALGMSADPVDVAKAIGYARQHNIPVALFLAQIAQESSWRPKAFRAEPGNYDATIKRQPKWSAYPRAAWGSRGYGQIMPGTAVDLGHPFGPEHLESLYDPDVNLGLASKLMGRLYARFGDWDKALQGYNAGPGNVGTQYGQDYIRLVRAKATKLTAAGVA